QRNADRRRLPGLRARQLPAAGVPRAGPGIGHRRTPQHGVAVSGEAVMSCSDERSREEPTKPARIPPGGFRELAPVNWAIARLGPRTIRAPKFHLFDVLGQHRLLFLAWLPFSGY